MFKKENGITLIALVITLIVLLILAGVSIAMLTGEDGILTQAKKAKEETEQTKIDEEEKIENYEQYIEEATNGGTLMGVTGSETENTIVYDRLENKIVVPPGFKIINPGDNVEDGIIIEDVSYKDTKGSQFVWIPVGKIKTSKGEKSIDLNRYIFNEDGTFTPQNNNKIKDSTMGVGFEELQNSNFENVVAKDIEDFKISVSKNGGYYIGRYEARTSQERKEETENEYLTKMSTKSDEYIYNWVTQLQASNLSRNMYNNDEKFVSDLANSYSWDTAIVYIQECSNNVKYSKQTTINTEFANKGTNNQQIQDKVCNIFDMGSNCMEWTTETCDYSEAPCVDRGDFFNRSSREELIQELFKTDFRNAVGSEKTEESVSFRPILYLK